MRPQPPAGQNRGDTAPRVLAGWHEADLLYWWQRGAEDDPDRIRSILRRAGYTNHAAIAKQFGCSTAAVGHWLSGRRRPRIAMALRLAEWLQGLQLEQISRDLAAESNPELARRRVVDQGRVEADRLATKARQARDRRETEAVRRQSP